MLSSENYMHAALHMMHSNNPESKSSPVEETPQEKAQRAQTAEYEQVRAREGLGVSDLGIGAILNNTNVMLVGFFTSFVYSQVVGIVNGKKTWQLALISFAVTWMCLALERFYLFTLGESSWLVSRTWSSIFRQFLRFFTYLMVFLTTNFGLALFTHQAEIAQTTWYESVALIYGSLLFFFYALKAFSSTAL